MGFAVDNFAGVHMKIKFVGLMAISAPA